MHVFLKEWQECGCEQTIVIPFAGMITAKRSSQGSLNKRKSLSYYLETRIPKSRAVDFSGVSLLSRRLKKRSRTAPFLWYPSFMLSLSRRDTDHKHPINNSILFPERPYLLL